MGSSVVPLNHGLSTVNDCRVVPNTEKCSRVLISIFSRMVVTGANVVSKR